MKRIDALVAAAVLFACPLLAAADGPAIGPKGGQMKDAGKYHLELVLAGRGLQVYVADGKGAPVASKGATGTATVLAGKTTSSVKLEPRGDNLLAGSGDFSAVPDMKVVVSVTLPGQSPIQARFTPLEAAKRKPSSK